MVKFHHCDGKMEQIGTFTTSSCKIGIGVSRMACVQLFIPIGDILQYGILVAITKDPSVLMGRAMEKNPYHVCIFIGL